MNGVGVGLNAVVNAIATAEREYVALNRGAALDPTELASTTIADSRVLAAVSLAWHEMNEPEADDTLKFEADVDLRFAALGLGFGTTAPASVEPIADLSISKHPPRERLSAETINLADHEVLELVLAPVVPPNTTR